MRLNREFFILFLALLLGVSTLEPVRALPAGGAPLGPEVLSVLDYVRTQAEAFTRANPNGFFDVVKFSNSLDPAKVQQATDVMTSALGRDALAPELADPAFRDQLNRGLRGLFATGAKSDVVLFLARKFMVQDLPVLYPAILPYQQYSFARSRDPASVQAALRESGVDPQKLYLKLSDVFPDGRIYHATRNEPAFRSILREGPFQSAGGSEGLGLYGLSRDTSDQFARQWAPGFDGLLSFRISEDAKIVDVTSGEGLRLRQQWKGLTSEQFADKIGADIVLYVPGSFVVKNGAVLSDPQGVHRTISSDDSVLKEAAAAPDLRALKALDDRLSTQGYSTDERDLALMHFRGRSFTSYERFQIMQAPAGTIPPQLATQETGQCIAAAVKGALP